MKTIYLAPVPIRYSTNFLTLLSQLHWLPEEFGLRFKVACLIYKTLTRNTFTYFQQLFSPYVPPRNLRSSDMSILAEPRYSTVVGPRAFHVAAPNLKEWNSLPISLFDA